MARIQGLKTGTQAFEAQEVASTKINFFKKPVPYTFLSTKSHCSGVILPAFDSSYSEQDPARATSVGSYRTDTSVDGIHKDFSDWLVALQVYTYFGKSWNMIVSPKVLGLNDPIVDLRTHIRFNCKDDPTLQKLIKLPEGASIKDKLPLPFYQQMGFCNAYCNPTYIKEGSDDTGEANRVLVLSRTASRKLFDDLNTYRPPFMRTPNDENWADYQYGDVTNPECCLRFNTDTTIMDNGGKASCLTFGNPPKVLPTRGRITKEMLAGRIDITDSDVLNVPSYEELVELLIEENNVPYDLIREVCENHYNGAFPKASTNRTYSTPAAPAKSSSVLDEDPADDISYAPSQSYAPTPAPAAAPKPAPVQTPSAAPAAADTLTPEELAELADLEKKLLTNTVDLPSIQRYQALKSRSLQ